MVFNLTHSQVIVPLHCVFNLFVFVVVKILFCSCQELLKMCKTKPTAEGEKPHSNSSSSFWLVGFWLFNDVICGNNAIK
jgi:hypothetical protein